MTLKSEEIILAKKLLRKKTRSVIEALSSDRIKKKSEAIGEKLFASKWWREADFVFCFISMNGEVETGRIIERALEEKKKVGLPRIEGNDLVFYFYNGREDRLLLNELGIREPGPDLKVIDPQCLNSRFSLILTPGLVFDRGKRRLGRGKGFYDRFLKRARSLKAGHFSAVGLSFSEQIQTRVPVGALDQLLDGLITDLEIIA